jgi:hypothetical protein
MSNMTQNTIDEQRLVYRVRTMADGGHDPDQGSIGRDWAMYLHEQVGLSDEMKSVVFRQGKSSNRAKPIGYFVGDDSLVAKQDPVKARDSAEAKRQSFIESFHFHAYQTKADSIYRVVHPDAIIPEVADVLDASALPNPDGDLLGYVERQFSQIDE